MFTQKSKTVIFITSCIIILAVAVGYYAVTNDGGTDARSSQNKNEQTIITEPAEAKSGSEQGPMPEEIVGKETPAQRLESLNLDTTPQQALEVKLPQEREKIANPPQWSQPQNTLSDPSEPPDPFKEPPMKVDPRRMPEDSGSDVDKDSQ